MDTNYIFFKYMTGSEYMSMQTARKVENKLCKFIFAKDDEVKGFGLNLERRVVEFHFGEYDESCTAAYGLSGKTRGERLFNAMDLILNRWCPETGITFQD